MTELNYMRDKEVNYKNLRKEVNRLVDLKGTDNWSDIRSSNNFNLVQRHYSFGVRMCYERKSENDVTYIDLQSSRGIGIQESDTLENVMSQIDETMQIIDSDTVRIEEIEAIWNDPQFKLGDINHTGFVELGFRVPRLMKHYGDKYNARVWGYDIAPLSISVTQELGYDGRTYDFNRCVGPLGLSGASLVVSYHMLEHLSDPMLAIKKVYESMDTGSFFHVEVPIEPGLPRLQFAHMFAFHSLDLMHMLREAGFEVLTSSTRTHPDGPWVERYMTRKLDG